jgi:protein disulfide-isomerase A6
MAPEYEKATKKLEIFSNQVLLAKANCDVERELGSRFKISGYPTLLWFPKGSRNPVNYNSGRDHQAILNFVERETGLRVPYKSIPTAKDYTSEELDAFLKDPKSNGIVMFYAPCKSLSIYAFDIRVWTLQDLEADIWPNFKDI